MATQTQVQKNQGLQIFVDRKGKTVFAIRRTVGPHKNDNLIEYGYVRGETLRDIMYLIQELMDNDNLVVNEMPYARIDTNITHEDDFIPCEITAHCLQRMRE